jgi:hypothetical protein
VDEVLRTAAEAMLTTPVRHPLSATVAEIRDFFRDDHVHAALIVSPAGYLEAVVERDDIARCQVPDAAAAPLGRLAGRTVLAGARLADVRRAMAATERRRAAVTSADGRLLGLLCFKASRTGFCSDRDVRTRALGESGTAAVGGAAIDRSGELACKRCRKRVSDRLELGTLRLQQFPGSESIRPSNTSLISKPEPMSRGSMTG